MLLLCAAVSAHASESRLPLRATAHLAAATFSIELALTNSERQRGLMRRPQLAANAGMLFVYAHPHVLSFWMKDTVIPLSIAFFDRRGQVINIEPLQPLSLDSVVAGAAAQYALEVNRGAFAQNDITIEAGLTLTDCPTRAALLRHAPQTVASAVLRLCR